MKKASIIFGAIVMISMTLHQCGNAPVSSEESAQSILITHPISGERIKVAVKDFDDKMNWESAKKACSSLGNGWRLPTYEELKVMHEELHKNAKGNFKPDVYWGNAWNDSSQAIMYYFNSGNSFSTNKLNEQHYVRAVRNF